MRVKNTQYIPRLFQKKNSDGSNVIPKVYEQLIDLLEEIYPELLSCDG